MHHIIRHFEQNDPLLAPYVRRLEMKDGLQSVEPSQYFVQLCREIVGQQLSGKAAKAIYTRFTVIFPQGQITPEALLAFSHEELRATGISNAKARYVRNIAEAVVAGELPFEHFPRLSDEEVVRVLTKVKGIGAWTSEMFLMFTLGRENVFSFGDLGLQKGIKHLYRFKTIPPRPKLEKLLAKWHPYRTYAALALWSVVDGGGDA